MDRTSDFATFLSNIRLTPAQRDDLKTGHHTLRDRLSADEELAEIVIATFLQGSYVRHTAVRPMGEKQADVDIIVVTNLDEREFTPQQALNVFRPFLDKHYKGKYEIQGRSISIEMGYVDLDVVVTSAPSEVDRANIQNAARSGAKSMEEAFDWFVANRVLNERAEPAWKTRPLRIPDRTVRQWVDTHPLEQIRWTRAKNKATAGHYVNVVKSVKWWRRLNPEPAYPKGYPMEALLGRCCPDAIQTVGEGVTLALEGIVSEFGPFAEVGMVPYLQDHGVVQNVLSRVSPEDFKAFMEMLKTAAQLARKAFDSTRPSESGGLWRDLFGDQFPEPPRPPRGSDDDGPEGGFTPRTAPTTLSGQRFG